jgi:hypothetical protein
MHPQCREEQSFEMEQSAKDLQTALTESNEIPEDLAVEIRRLAHNLSNALEIIVQTSFLLSTTEMKEPASDWLRMLEGGVQKALDINLELRKYVKDHTPR